MQDGIDHINIYSQAKTELGRWMSNFALTDVILEGKVFASLEAYWYWLSTGQIHDHLIRLGGFKAKQEGKKLPKVHMDETQFQNLIKAAMRAKLRCYPTFAKLLKESILPFRHYYVFGGKVKEAGYLWIVEEWELIRKELQMVKKPRAYAGIGSRETPQVILEKMSALAYELNLKGLYLRTGNALGADQAFAWGSNRADPKKTILYLPWKGYEEKAIKEGNHVVIGTEVLPLFQQAAKETVALLHPYPKALKQGAWKLHQRNCYILLGKDLNHPVDFVVCWTKDGQATGGTGMGIRIAERNSILVFNLYTNTIDQIMAYVG